MVISRKLNLLLGLLLALLLLSSLLQLVAYGDVARDAAMINTLGMIRGGLQRYAKRILHGLPATAAEGEINRQIDELLQTIDHPPLRAALKRLERLWQAFRTDYEMGARPGITFLDRSEKLWETSVRTVLLAQSDSEQKLTVFRSVAYVMLGAVLLALILLFFVRRSVRGNLEIRASHDALTGLLGRASFEELFEDELHHSRRRGIPLSLLYLDLDHFKSINDRFGHDMGDRVLQHTATILTGAIRKGDILARLGGEEFAVVVRAADSQAALQIAEKILQAFRGSAFPHGDPLTVSIGVSSTDRAETTGQLLRSADRAMYDAKRTGRDRVVCAE